MSAIVGLPVKVFTRDNPCTKVDLHNCFMSDGSSKPVPAIVGRGIIGVNAIRYLVNSGYARKYESGGVDYWELTESGVDWLTKGLARHLKLHPEDRVKLATIGGGNVVRRRRIK